MELKRRRLRARRSHVSHLSLLVEITRHHTRHDSPTEERGKRGSRQRERDIRMDSGQVSTMNGGGQEDLLVLGSNLVAA
jgi:hypothetical protein